MSEGIPYENQLIGAFLYAVGYADATYAARRGDGAAAGPDARRALMLNLFQQTPLDATFNDLVVGRERCMVIEFKRSLQHLTDERAKSNSLLRDALARDDHFASESTKGHIVLYARQDAKAIDLRICRYLDVLGLRPPIELDRASARGLADHLANPAPDNPIGLAPHAMLAYLEQLRRLRTEQVGTGGRDHTEAWLGIARGADGLRTVVADSLDTLLGLQHDHELTRAHKRARDREHDRSPGMDR